MFFCSSGSKSFVLFLLINAVNMDSYLSASDKTSCTKLLEKESSRLRNSHGTQKKKTKNKGSRTFNKLLLKRLLKVFTFSIFLIKNLSIFNKQTKKLNYI